MQPASHVVSIPVASACGRDVADALSEWLGDADAAISLTLGGPDRWLIELHSAAPPDMEALRHWVAGIVGAEAAAQIGMQTVAERDWVAASLAGLAPVRAGRFVVHGSHDRDRVAPPAIGIEIEAALAFGTGHHGTTRGCLLALDELLKERPPARVLDIGTGTGVLAIAAAKALRRTVTASDIDPIAVGVARDNARDNGAGTFVRCVHAAGLGAGALQRGAPYDLVLANILLLPLQRLAAPMAGVAAPGAAVILSGLLPAHANAALAAYRATGFVLVRRFDIEGWTTLRLRRASTRPLSQ